MRPEVCCVVVFTLASDASTTTCCCTVARPRTKFTGRLWPIVREMPLCCCVSNPSWAAETRIGANGHRRRKEAPFRISRVRCVLRRFQFGATVTVAPETRCTARVMHSAADGAAYDLGMRGESADEKTELG